MNTLYQKVRDIYGQTKTNHNPKTTTYQLAELPQTAEVAARAQAHSTESLRHDDLFLSLKLDRNSFIDLQPNGEENEESIV